MFKKHHPEKQGKEEKEKNVEVLLPGIALSDILRFKLQNSCRIAVQKVRSINSMMTFAKLTNFNLFLQY